MPSPSNLIGSLRSFRPKRPTKAIHNYLLGGLCLATISFAISSIGSSPTSSAATRQTTTVSRGVVQSTVSGSGSLEAAQQVELNFGASGEVKAISVKAGDHVSKGEVLASIDSSSAQASLAEARAGLYEAEETLETAEEAEDESEETAYDSASASGGSELVDYLAGEGVASTQAPDAESEAPAAGAEGKAGAEVKTPGEDGEKGGGNSGKGGEGQSETSAGEPSAKEPEAAPEASSPEAVEAAPESSAAGSAEPAGSAAGATVSLATAEAKLREARLSVKSAEQEVSETTLRAPIAGTVASISGEVGETVSGTSSSSVSSAPSSSSAGGIEGESSSGGSESAFLVLSQLGTMKMQVAFSESDVNKLKTGQAAIVAISSMEESELAGKVTHVDLLPAEGGSSGVVEYDATIVLTQSEKGLRAGMSATAEVVVEEAKNALAVPSEAITSAGPAKTVTVQESGGREATNTVTTGLVGDETTQLISGVKVGETLLLPEVSVTAAPAGGEGAEGGLPSGFPSGGGFPGGGAPPSGLGG
jgi:multidrug efflux pump subunit AcrA (membrane-fusion protein)